MSEVKTNHGIGSKKILFLRQDNNSSLIEVSQYILKKHESIETHSHISKSESYIFLQGKGEITVNEKTYYVQSADHIYVDKKNKHSLTNIGDDELSFIIHHIEC